MIGVVIGVAIGYDIKRRQMLPNLLLLPHAYQARVLTHVLTLTCLAFHSLVYLTG